MRIGISQGVAALDGEDILGCTARLGVDGVEPFIGTADDERLFWSQSQVDEFAARAKSLGVLVPSVAVGLFNGDSALVDPTRRDRAVDLTSRGLKLSAGLGAEVMLLCTYFESHPDTRAKKDAVLEVIREVEPVAADAGVTIALESPLPADELAQLADEAASEVVAVYYDFGNAVALGFDPVAEVETLGARIVSVHVKDCVDTVGGMHLGEGNLDLPAAMAAVKHIGYDGWLIVETPGDDEAAVREDLRTLSQLEQSP